MNKLRVMKYALISYSQGRKVFLSHVPVCVVLALFFTAFSQLDLTLSHLFYQSQLIGSKAGATGFWLSNASVLHFIYTAVDWLARLAIIGSLAVLVWYGVTKNPRVFYAAVVVLAFLFGPLLTVNGVFKEYWGRARPGQIVEFNGHKAFTAAWIVSNQCQHNCSFTSGHAAAGFALSIGYFVSRRKRWLYAGILLGSAIGITRMMNGAHFFSDILFSYFLVMIIGSVVTMVFARGVLLSFQRNRKLFGTRPGA